MRFFQFILMLLANMHFTYDTFRTSFANMYNPQSFSANFTHSRFSLFFAFYYAIITHSFAAFFTSRRKLVKEFVTIQFVTNVAKILCHFKLIKNPYKESFVYLSTSLWKYFSDFSDGKAALSKVWTLWCYVVWW